MTAANPAEIPTKILAIKINWRCDNFDLMNKIL
jgi:hypothetical protein